MEEKVITVIPVTASGIGSFIDVIVDDTKYRSEVVQEELTEETMEKLIYSLLETIPHDIREAVELKYYALVQAMKNNTSEEVVENINVLNEENNE